MSDTQETSFIEQAKLAVYHLIKANDRISEERVELSKSVMKFEETVEKFTKNVQHFETLDERVRRSLTDNLEKTAKQVGVVMGELASQASMKNVNESLDKLNRGIHNAKVSLEFAADEVRSFSWKTFLLLFMGCVLTGLLGTLFVAHFWIGKMEVSMTKQQADMYEFGVLMSQLVPEMTEADKERFKKLMAQSINNKKNKVLK